MSERDLRENPFRDEIFDCFVNHGYKISNRGDYDYEHALDTAKLFEFLENSQPRELEKLKNTYGGNYKARFIDLLCRKISERGLLNALREKVEDYASNVKIELAYYKSGVAEMAESHALYEKNIFSVRKEFSYEDKPDSFRVDLALFLNGIPVVMIELKKQTAGQKAVFEGTEQFKETRDPSQLVFSFNKRTLVYFAMDEMVAFLTTRLDRADTTFLPFNMGAEDDGAGNPVTPGKHCTYYVWENILQKDMLLRIFREFMFVDDEGKMIFPRYHQLRAVLRCEADVKENGIGGRYLIWHSAGSGKTKTIAWLAMRLKNLPEPSINTVIVISDRTVIDGQLGSELMNVDGQRGVAQHVDDGSEGLSRRIKDGGYIIVTTLQKFRPILNKIKQYPQRNYAIIIDEAHSSTAGKSMSKASETLTGKSLRDSVELDDIYDEMEDGQNQLIRDAAVIRSTRNVSYFAFTATPKTETMELFGTRKSERGKTYFDKYSMKQAIEERFILNPLLCYTKYSETYRIDKKRDDSTEYDSARAQAAILNYVSTSDEVIETKVQIMMDDFIEYRQSWLGGKAKAIIITPSRKHAVCYKLAIDEYLKKRGCSFGACVAFTGTIEHKNYKYTEEAMNAKWRNTEATYDIKSIIHNHDDLRIIVVADKLQTGFDESKLCVMYIDKKLNSEVKAVQTISRLNRPDKNKRTFVLDFVNSIETIKAYFIKYYGGDLFLPTENETDPNILFSKRDHIFDYCIITLLDADKLHKLITDTRGEHSGEITSIIAGISRSFKALDDDKKKTFLAELKKFSKLFYYISAVYNTWNEDMEKLAVVFSVVYNVLFEPDTSERIDPAALVNLVEYSTKLAEEELTIELHREEQEFEGISTEISIAERSYSMLDEIIERFNAHYANASTEIREIVDSLSEDEDLRMNVRNSTPSAYESAVGERFALRINDNILDGILTGDSEKAEYYTALSKEKSIQRQICNIIIRKIKDWLNLAG